MSFLGFAQHGITLKELLENPDLQNPPQLNKNDVEGKKGENNSGIDLTSAFLGPNLWNNNSYENNDFSLEYMDLDEFLCENGIPVNLDDNSNNSDNSSPKSPSKEDPSSSPQQQNSPGVDLSTFCLQNQSPKSSCSSPEPLSPCVPPNGVLSPTQEDVFLTLQELCDDEDDGDDDDGDNHETVVANKVDIVNEQLVNIPGQDNFDPRKRKFTAEELKPQPIIKKSRKVFVPDDCKDEKYWCRRKKNNVAAKRSRDARRIKENQIAMRASFLEKENTTMKEELRKLKEENSVLIKKLQKYEKGACST